MNHRKHAFALPDDKLFVRQLSFGITDRTGFAQHDIAPFAFRAWPQPYKRRAVTVHALVLAVVPIGTLAYLAFFRHILSFRPLRGESSVQ
jgi:hypothetical protein